MLVVMLLIGGNKTDKAGVYWRGGSGGPPC